MGKGEIARYEQFLLFPQCFQKACFQGASKGVIVWEWVNTEDYAVGGKRRNADFQHFLHHNVFELWIVSLTPYNQSGLL